MLPLAIPHFNNNAASGWAATTVPIFQHHSRHHQTLRNGGHLISDRNTNNRIAIDAAITIVDAYH